VICEFIIGTVESNLNNNATISEIEQILENFPCNELPPAIAAQCKIFIETFTPKLIQWILDNEPPHEFCLEVSLCNSKK